MATYRRAERSDRARYMDFINLVFSMAHEPHDFKALIPKVYADGRDTDALQLIAEDGDGNIRGLVALMPAVMHVCGQELNTGYLGTVSVHPYARGEGHMKELMNRTIDDARAAGCDLIMLGGQRQRYEYFGFNKGGVLHYHVVTTTNLRHAMRGVDTSGIAFLPMESADVQLIDSAHALSQSAAVHAVRSREDFACICATWRSKPHIVTVDGQFAGYLIATANLEVVTEIALINDALYGAAIKAWLEHAAVARCGFRASEYNVPLNRALMAVAENCAIETAGMLRVLNFPKVLGAMMKAKALTAELASGQLSLVIDGEPITIAVEGGQISVLQTAPEAAPQMTALDAQKLLFSPLGKYMEVALPAGWFPLPLYTHPADEF